MSCEKTNDLKEEQQDQSANSTKSESQKPTSNSSRHSHRKKPPQIPQFISQAPWYFVEKEKSQVPIKNLTEQHHQSIQDLNPSKRSKSQTVAFDEKRDRWSGYEPEEYKKVIESWHEKPQEKQSEGEKSSNEPPERRSRKDIVAYLRQGEEAVAFWDPKTRAFKPKSGNFVGDEFVMEEASSNCSTEKNCIFAWESEKRAEKNQSEDQIPKLPSSNDDVNEQQQKPDEIEQRNFIKKSLLDKFS